MIPLQVAEALGLADNSRVAVTVGLLVAFVLLAGIVYRYGGWLKALFADDDAAEAVQSVVLTLLGIAIAAVLVDIWRLGTELSVAFQTVTPDQPAQAGVKLMVSLLAFGAAYTFTRITKRLIKRESERDAISAHQKEIGHHILQILVFLPAVLFVIRLWGTKPADLLLGAGAFGLVVGLAARQTLGSVLAGFVLLFARPFEIGDWVVIGEEEGVVMDVSIFNTEIRTFDNEHVVVPNEQVANEEIVNRSRTDQLRVKVDVGVDYDVDVTEAARIAEEAMEECDDVVDTPRPDVVMDQFGASSVVLTLRFWIDDPTIQRKWAAQNAVVDAVKRAFERESVKIPYPQRELSGRAETDGLRVAPTRDVGVEDEGASGSDGAGCGSADGAGADGDGDDSREDETSEPPEPAADGGPEDPTPTEEGDST